MITDEKGNKIKIKLIEDYLKTNDMSKTQFCKMCKISPNTFAKITSDDTDYSVTSLFKIANVLGISMQDMFE